jgi:hypothetical protein
VGAQVVILRVRILLRGGKSAKRPTFAHTPSATVFARSYWLKSELIDACRALGVSPTGSEPELAARIVAALSGVDAPEVTLRIDALAGTRATLP